MTAILVCCRCSGADLVCRPCVVARLRDCANVWRTIPRDAYDGNGYARALDMLTDEITEGGLVSDDDTDGAPDAKTEESVSDQAFDFRGHLKRQREWSGRTFGPGQRTAGVVDHIQRELWEITAKPDDLSEWIDVVILALDGAWRMGASPNEIIAALVAKQTKNEAREWPDWHTAEPDKAIEHVRKGKL